MAIHLERPKSLIEELGWLRAAPILLAVGAVLLVSQATAVYMATNGISGASITVLLACAVTFAALLPLISSKKINRLPPLMPQPNKAKQEGTP